MLCTTWRAAQRVVQRYSLRQTSMSNSIGFLHRCQKLLKTNYLDWYRVWYPELKTETLRMTWHCFHICSKACKVKQTEKVDHVTRCMILKIHLTRPRWWRWKIQHIGNKCKMSTNSKSAGLQVSWQLQQQRHRNRSSSSQSCGTSLHRLQNIWKLSALHKKTVSKSTSPTSSQFSSMRQKPGVTIKRSRAGSELLWDDVSIEPQNPQGTACYHANKVSWRTGITTLWKR